LKAIVRELDICGCGEQAAKEASVRTIASAPRAYDCSHDERDPQTLRLRPGRRSCGLSTNGQPLQKSKAVEGAGFQQALTQALGAVSKSQNDATAMQREVQLDNPTVSIEQTMVAMQKAQIGFQATLQVRNKMVQAYSDIMSMQV